MRRRVAQFGRALRSGRRGRKFESCHADKRKGLQSSLFSLFMITQMVRRACHFVVMVIRKMERYYEK